MNMRKQVVLLAVSVLLASASASASYTVAQDRDSGRVTLSQAVGQDVQAPRAGDNANRLATRRCEQLGYALTDASVQVSRQCTASAADGQCTQWQQAQTYQCMGDAVAQPYQPVQAPVAPNG